MISLAGQLHRQISSIDLRLSVRRVLLSMFLLLLPVSAVPSASAEAAPAERSAHALELAAGIVAMARAAEGVDPGRLTAAMDQMRAQFADTPPSQSDLEALRSMALGMIDLGLAAAAGDPARTEALRHARADMLMAAIDTGEASLILAQLAGNGDKKDGSRKVPRRRWARPGRSTAPRH